MRQVEREPRAIRGCRRRWCCGSGSGRPGVAGVELHGEAGADRAARRCPGAHIRPSSRWRATLAMPHTEPGVGSRPRQRWRRRVGVREHDEVVDDRGVAGLDLEALVPEVLLEPGLHCSSGTRRRLPCRAAMWVSGTQSRSGCACFQPLEGGELARRRQVGGVALGRALIDPGHDGGDLLLAQVLVAFNGPRVGVRRARAACRGRPPLGDRLRPRARLLVAAQRHRPDVAGPVAGLAALLEDRRDVARVGDAALRRVGLGRGERGAAGDDRGGEDRGRADDVVVHSVIVAS